MPGDNIATSSRVKCATWEFTPKSRPAKLPPPRSPVSKGIIISGGPASVYDPASPTIDPQLLASGTPVLGICYGQQLMAHLLGGKVQKGNRGEYGFAQLEISSSDGVLRGIAGRQQVWMSHFDTVVEPPVGFSVLASTDTCTIAAIAAPDRGLYAVQFHPEVAHTPCGRDLLSNFIFDICHCEKDWDPARPDSRGGGSDPHCGRWAQHFSSSSAAA